MCDDEYSRGELNAMLEQATYYYLDKGYSKKGAYHLAMEAVQEKTVYSRGPRAERGRGRDDRWADRVEAAFGIPVDDLSARGRPRRYTEESAREPSRRYAEEAPRGYRTEIRQPKPQTGGTEFDHMFQNGKDRNAARTSGKILSAGDIRKRAWQIQCDLMDEGADEEHARQQGEQFLVREFGKRVRAKLETAGLPSDYNLDEENEKRSRRAGGGREQSAREDDEMRGGERARRGGGREKFARDEEDEYRAGRGRSSPKEYDDYRPRREQSSRSEYAARDASPQGRYNTSYNYTDRELRDITENIYDEWIDKGARPEEARHEAKKWFNRHKGGAAGSSSRPSGFDSFRDIRDSLDDDNGYARRSRSSRGPRAGKSRSPQSDQYCNDEPAEEPRYSSRGGPRGYRTEERRPTEEPRYSSRGDPRGYRTKERRPSGFSSGNYNGSDDRSGWHDRNDQPSGVKPDVSLYEVLGVRKSATVEEIKAAHRKLCIKHHPDRVKGGPAAKKAATEMMAQINQACDVLMDRKMREFYDRTGLIASMGESPDA